MVGCLSTEVVGDQTFCQIGNGPAIDKTAMSKWMGSGSSRYTNHEGKPMFINSEQYRSINGFLPPSFSFFPYGLNEDSYRPDDPSLSVLDPTNEVKNVESGRAICMQACKDTGCIAVQTEVPQLCYEKRVTVPLPEGLSGDSESSYTTKGDCKGKATHGCTMFYEDVKSADNAYYDLSGGVQQASDPTIPFKLGQKYYENNKAPQVSPGTKRPSDETVKWCKPNVTNINQVYTKFKTNVGASDDCSCTQGTVDCEDPNCCVYRDLITTEWAKHNTPYYNLPIDVTKTQAIEDGSPAAICPAKDENGDCCGYCENSDGEYELRSCPQNKIYMDGTQSNPIIGDVWWGVDTKRAACMWPDKEWWSVFLGPKTGKGAWVYNDYNTYSGEKREMEECVEEYAAAKNSDPSKAFRELNKCCGYLDQSCVDTVTQPFCSSTSGGVNRGCFGDPHILTVDSIVGEIGSCDNPSIISPDNRCVQDYEGKACTGFPYACETGPLWVMQ